MTKQDAHRLNNLSQAVIDCKEWIETIEKCKRPVVVFANIGLRLSANDSSTDGFDGELRIPREIAIRMLKWAEDQVSRELSEH